MTEELKSCSCEHCIRAWSELERMRNLLEDVVNALDLSEIAIETHGPLGTEPAELVKLVLQQKDREIALLRHEPDGLPEWLKEILNEDILFSFDNLNRSKDLNNKISNSNWATRINTVKWVLSLRKPKDNAP